MSDTGQMDVAGANALAAEMRDAVPFAADQMDMLIRILEEAGKPIARFMDLGCGDGVMCEAVLRKFPKAGGVLMDIDDPSLEQAWSRIGEAADQLVFVNQDLADPDWAESVRSIAPFDLIVSGFVIHQQPDERKVDIYGDIFDLLGPGGLFLNLDFVAAGAPFARRVFDQMYVDSLVARRKKRKGDARKEAEADFHAAFDRAKLHLASTDEQCGWLREIGFVGVDTYFKAIGVALLCATKPGGILQPRKGAANAAAPAQPAPAPPAKQGDAPAPQA